MTARPFWRAFPLLLPPGSQQIPGDVCLLAAVSAQQWRPRKGEDSVPNYYSVSTFSPEEFREIFLAAHGDADLSGDPAEWFRDRTVNDSGRVERVTIGGVSVEGTEVRRLFSLRSACFTVDTGEEGVAFRVTGFGHGVGMSQYGAELLARQGKTWQEIIHWYYADVTIGAYKE